MYLGAPTLPVRCDIVGTSRRVSASKTGVSAVLVLKNIPGMWVREDIKPPLKLRFIAETPVCNSTEG